MKEKVDFLFRYEHKVREIESIMLLRTELERRGYSVAFDANYDYKSENKYKPKVFICPSLYSNANLSLDFMKYGLVNKIANLLWEQVFLREVEDNPNCPYNVTGIGQRGVNFCWGRKTHERICKAGVQPMNAPIVGQVNSDYLREEFHSILYTKSELAQMYNLNPHQRWNFFISSFSACELDFRQKEMTEKECGKEYMDYQINISNLSRNGILKWFEAAMQIYPDDIFIYRPHPSEAKKSQVLKDLEIRYPNFKVLSEQSIKHWISASDKIYNWYSTGHIDVVMLNKPCRLLRPVQIKTEHDYNIFISARKIRTEADFLSDYENLDVIEVVDSSLLDIYYYNHGDFVYRKVCDILEELLLTNRYDIKYSFSEKVWYYKRKLRYEISKNFKFIIPIIKHFPLLKSYFSRRDAIHQILVDGYSRNVASNSDLEVIKNKISPIIENISRKIWQ